MAEDDKIHPINSNDWEEPPKGTPEHLRDDPLYMYSCCRYSQRDAFMQMLSVPQKHAIVSELEGIEKLRARFLRQVDNVNVTQCMESYRSQWRLQAKERCDVEIMKCMRTLRDALPRDQDLWRRRLELLKAVKVWDLSPDYPSPRVSLEDSPDDGFQVNKISLSKIAPSEESGVSYYGDYCLDTYPLNDVLYNEQRSPLKQEHHDQNSIRYFHFPANNMLWVEESIARYYGERRGEYNNRKAWNYCQKASGILCREVWTGRQHGSINDPVHSRYMRSQCSFIPNTYPAESNSEANGPSNKNFVIFMPYLHWETHLRCREMAAVIRSITERTADRRRRENPETANLAEKFSTVVEMARIKYSGETLADPIIQRPVQHTTMSPLGKYLLAAANIYKAFDTYLNVRELRDHLYPELNPPTHPRRTLDQSYYCNLADTELRDQDQVVYRGTRAGKSLSKTTKIIMVDQLWLYVLDERTVLTFFPERWGRNNSDPSGIFEGIRSRLEYLLPGEVRSAFDLALVIMNECSTFFSDRSKPTDERPQLLDIFANAVVRVSHMKEVAFEGFWRHLERTNLDGRNMTEYEGIEAAARIYLNIKPEAGLLREAQDIVEELHMMDRIYLQQLRVARLFSKTLNGLNEQQSTWEASQQAKAHMKSMRNVKTSDLQTGFSPSGGQHTVFSVQNIKNTQIGSLHQPVSKTTLDKAEKLIEEIESCRTELQDLEQNTNEIIEHLKYVFDLKIQQGSIIEAKSALARAEESVTQGRSIMMFTVVTIIFLPLSFMSSIFGMNAKELSGPGGATMPIQHQFKIMFLVSLGVTAVSLSVAFNAWIRSRFTSLAIFLWNFVSFLPNVVWAAIIEYTGLRRLWKFTSQGAVLKGSLRETKHRVVNEIYSSRDRRENRKAVRRAQVLAASHV
ncbi:hypothetical protein B0O99DRAFT_726757 [Bisporella sp. PMI_857]|nr:hypothetical protein B0O99DRAFT_726757 [Bisporella sp. PMI_857]